MCGGQQTLDPLFLFLSTVWDMEKVKKKKPEEVKLSYHPTTKEVATYYTSYIEIAILSA